MSFRPRMFSALALALTVSFVGVGCVAPDRDDEDVGANGAELSTVASFGSNPGNLKMYVHAPANLAPGAPVVVALHGCTMTAQSYVNTGWSQLADAWGFYVVYAEQSTSNNGSRCFRWFDAAQAKRNGGEALSIKQMVDHMKTTYAVDASRVFVTGLSAGAAMSVSMLAAYPDVFSAGAPMAGMPHACVSSINDSYKCMGGQIDRTPSAWGDLVRAAAPNVAAAPPRISIWQGTSDYTVSTKNQQELVDQWTNVHGLDLTADATSTVSGAARVEHRNAAGHTLVETWSIPGMGHGTAVDPGFAAANGCGTASSYILDVNVCSTYRAAQFFGLDPAADPPADDPPADDPPADDPPADDPPADDPPADDPPADDPPADDPPAAVCTEFVATNYAHVVAGRATRCGIGGSYVCATGSGVNFGLWNMMTSTLHEVPAGYFTPGKCP